MTRRVRFTPFLRAGTFAAGVALAAVPARAGDVPFITPAPISSTADNAESVIAADVDGDGDLDVVSASSLDDKLAWYENAAGNGTLWTLRTITTAADGARAAVAADVDRDGDVDVVAASLLDDTVAWYENTTGNGTAWTAHVITTAADGAAAVFVADVDGDGDPDVVSGSLFDGKVAWYENTAGNGTAWTTRIVTTQAVDPGSVFAADLDGDGDVDVLSASGFGARVNWYENSNGAGTAWTTRTISTALYNARSVAAADLDGDGDLDVLAATEIPGVLWYENTAGNGTAWTQHGVASVAGADDAAVADFDHDGDLDVVSASAAAVLWHENSAGNGSAWITRTISGAGTGTGSVASADLDGDGDLDALSAASGNDRIAWHRNDTIHETACFATSTPVASGLASPREVAAADVDGDGDPDVLAALFAIGPAAGQVVWEENALGNATAWTPHTISTGSNELIAVTPADVDGDGDLDAVTIGYYSGLAWHRNDAGNGSAWTRIGFGSTGMATAVADIDGDGDLDALESVNFFDNLVRWWENVGGNGGSWPYHTIAVMTMGGAAYSLAAADLDGDGDLDVLTDVLPPGPGAMWFENAAGNGSSWTTHTLPAASSFDLRPADVDGDGDLDVVVAGGAVTWLENVTGTASTWLTHTIAATGGGYAALVADLDGDGDVDVVTAAMGANSLVWHENTAGNGAAWSSHPLPAGGDDRRGVATADLDRDGDLDLLAGSTSGGRVDWFENGAGQFFLLAIDVSPGGAANGDLVPMLLVQATHLGRAGDGDLELASLGLLFEETAGDPLSSAEANALIESLRVYHDANGNGVFDPGSDTLVATVPTLALVNGVQTVTFADGDPNLQITPTTTRVYFVVTELTGNASTQTPNQFRVTHLGTGASASRAEDRTYDIPLRPACPADVSAAVGPITPVELQGFTIE